MDLQTPYAAYSHSHQLKFVLYFKSETLVYIVYKDKKEFTADMKKIYNAPDKEIAAEELDNLERKLEGKYPYAILSWRNNWDDLTVFFQPRWKSEKKSIPQISLRT